VSGHDEAVPRPSISRKLGPVSTALLLFDLWRRLPPRQRRWVLAQARKHGPAVVKQANSIRKARRR
jgi:hypothetical protein